MAELIVSYRTLGHKLAVLREQRGLSIREVEAKTGVNRTIINRLERGKMPGTVESHAKLARCYGVTLAQLYEGVEPEALGSTTVQTAASRVDYYRNPGLGFTLQPLTTATLERHMLPVYLLLAAGGQTPQEQTRPGIEKFLCVVEGSVEVTVGDQTQTLQQDDSLYFDASLPHLIKNLGAVPAKCFLVSSPPAL